MGEQRVAGLLNFVVVAAVAAVAYTDWLIVADVSLAYLYVLPIALCALVNPLPFTIGLGTICTFLGDIFGPPAPSLYWRIVHNVVYLASFVVVGFLVTLIAQQRDRMAEEVREQRDAYERDLALAAQVQRRVLPKPLTLPGVDIAAKMKTARMLGGDYYDFFPVSDDVIDVVIADVSGKGAAAALLMPSLAVALRLRARELEAPSEVIQDLDEILKQITNAATFVTMFYARLNRVTRTLQYANAGHNPPVLLRASSCESQFLDEAGGPILGILPNAQYSDTSLTLAQGDILTLFTDGVTEQENEQGEEFSVDRLEDVICRDGGGSAAQVVAHVSEAVAVFAGETEQADDLTLVVLKVL
ncbi:PP2C family protein-serine/threonine phosphatase [Alloacidobacterium dinghuense]|uniref:PP2C family protein-serine/threonine phosphatase n=1 Tax=Alloacidobacterium dinghuense TaxID=2763107 RepID=A0A7G8BFJ5_9BACT|nr:PP2C family protein-serine/threonine phosphatase [Alloacidobacterium dinghuense]QNI31315.1 PP2C family protein-serine/threonine phosphatase [Alloacidobacterium dinghuense]